MRLINSELLGAFVDVDTYSRFNLTRHAKAAQSREYNEYFRTKSRTIRLMVSIFVDMNEDFMALVEKWRKVKK